MYIEKCASDNDSYWAFPSLTDAVQLMSTDASRFDQYRDWLISVLFLNTTFPGYICVCIGAIQNTYRPYGEYGHIQNASLAIRNWLRLHRPDCIAGDSAAYAQDTIYLRQHGIDPTKWPPLDSIGLGFLDSLAKAGISSSSTPLSPIYLGAFISSPNPFIKETTLEFTLNRMAYITLEVYDELGRVVWGDSRGSSLEAGVHTIHLDGNVLPRGTLYARISIGFGEVKTVKLVHE
jgi:hypothetical protein